VEVCPTGALKFGEENDLKDLINKAEILHPEYGARPRVYYIGLPKSFIAGSIYDPNEDECIAGAAVTLTNLESGEIFTTSTDSFGDFWFDNLKTGSFSLSIKADGFPIKHIKSIRTDTDINLGDISLGETW
jgi:tetrathionate reductase subunit B